MVDIDLDKVCRVCLQSDVKLSLLFEDRSAVSGVGWSDMISECTMYKVWRYDGFPEFICDNCKQRLHTAYAFKKQFEASHRKLISLLELNLVLPEQSSDLNDKCTQTDDSSLYPCEKCDEKFITYERLRDHRLSAHKGTANACRLCPKSFSRISDLKNHIAVYHPESGFTPNECEICKKKFIRKDHVTRHLRKVHKISAGSNGSSEKENNSVFDQINMLEKQQSKGVSAMDSEYSREIKTDTNKMELKKVEMEYLVHEPKLEILSDYDSMDRGGNENNSKDFVEFNSLHIDEDRKFFLDGVSQNVAENLVNLPDIRKESNEALSGNHPEGLSLKHFETSVEEKLVASETGRRFKCDQCEKEYVRRSHLKRHILSHSQVKSFTCRMCNKQFHRSDHLKKHYRSRHKLGLQLKRLCASRKDDCTAEVTQGTESCVLNQVEGFEITFCGNDLDSKNAIEVEEQKQNLNTLANFDLVGHNENSSCSYKSSSRQFKCAQCYKMYARNDHLRRHMLSHSKEKHYSCDICDKQYNRSDHLKNHLSKHHSDKP